MDNFIKIHSIELPENETIVNTRYIAYIEKQKRQAVNQLQYIVNVRGYFNIVVSKEEYERVKLLLWGGTDNE